MRFVDFLKATVLLSAGSATALAAVTVLTAGADAEGPLVVFVAAWWLLAGVIGIVLGRRAETTSPIARLLASATTTSSLPELKPGSVLLNRLWPLLLATVLGIGLALLGPQIPAIAAGFAAIWALAWRRQERAVTAIEERDGVAFYVEQTSPVRAIRLVRAPGFRRDRARLDGAPG